MDKKEFLKEVRDCALEVSEELGRGYTEDKYQNAIAVELKRRGIDYQKEETVEIFYKGECVGVGFADLVVGDEVKVVVELKQKSSISDKDRAQLHGYLKSTKYAHGLIINFPYLEEPEFEQISTKSGWKKIE